MIEVVKGDIFESGCNTLVNPVNCKGTMGAGLAKEFKKRFPKVFDQYVRICNRGQLELGGALFVHTGQLFDPEWIVLFPTKNHWSDRSGIMNIRDSLKLLVKLIKHNSTPSIAVPALGCGLGGLEWNEVFNLMKHAFKNLKHCNVKIYEPL